jgi:hypothetical protein
MVYVFLKSLMVSNSYLHKRVDCQVPETRKLNCFKLFVGHLSCTALSKEKQAPVPQCF